MPSGEKPYRVYRGGRTKGKVPASPRSERDERRDGRGAVPVAVRTPARRRLSRASVVTLALAGLLLAAAVWAGATYLVVRNGVREANARLPAAARAALAPQEGLLLARPTVIALFGTDHAATVEARQGFRRADSIMLVRTDPARNRIAYLSIPRDLRVPIPGHNPDRINAAFQLGGEALAIRTVRAFTGIPVNHVAVVDFGRFEGLVDAIGGITVTVPRPIISNRFDCPYPTPAQCRRWPGWRFPEGEVELDGRRALIYSRIRENRLNPAETDVARTARQQQVVQAIAAKVLSPLTLLRMPAIGDDLTRPLATDLSAWQLLQLGWRKLRADDARTLRCRLGGEPTSVGGASMLIPSEENRNVVAMFLGASAPQPPAPGSPFAPGCVVGGTA